ncbi:TetR/AcrR family transcriptional regulator [Kribbella sp. NPDC056951]|uniref:TetR/AcrR family transcriptional regulator n=1 Tax=Kribbella sp. NPDC056951 TaxID=3345978 RepID=UPI003630B702
MATGTRDRIIDAALALFAERGVAAVPVTAIEAAAGLAAGSGAFYRHFRNKTELVDALVDRELARARDRVPPARDEADGNATEVLTTRLRGDLDFLRELGPLIHILVWERGRNPELVERLRSTVFEASIESGMAEVLSLAPTQAVQDDPEAAAQVMLSAMIGFFLAEEYYGRPAGPVSADRFARALAALLTSEP